MKTSVRLHIDQMMRTRNVRARNEVAERGAVTKSRKGVERKVGECYQWKATGQCSKGDSCSFSHELATGNSGGIHRRKGNRLTARDKNHQKNQATKRKALQIKGTRFHADTEIVTIRHVVIGILPYVKTTKSQSRKYGNKCYFRHVEADGKRQSQLTNLRHLDRL